MNYDDWLLADRRRNIAQWDYGYRWLPDPGRDRWAADPAGEHRLSWAPDTGELYATDRAGRSVHVLATVTDHATLDALLDGWAVAGGRPDASLAWVHDRVEQYVALTRVLPQPGDLPGLGTDWRAALTPLEQARYAYPGEPRWSLPAEPVAAAVRGLREVPGMDDAELDTFATGLGLDADWLADVLDSVTTDLDVGEIAAVDESSRPVDRVLR